MGYDVEVEPDGDAWNIRVPALRRSTQALRLADVDTMAIDLITLMTGKDPSGITLHVHVTPPSIGRHGCAAPPRP